jgi:hypothetical protein
VDGLFDVPPLCSTWIAHKTEFSFLFTVGFALEYVGFVGASQYERKGPFIPKGYFFAALRCWAL